MVWLYIESVAALAAVLAAAWVLAAEVEALEEINPLATEVVAPTAAEMPIAAGTEMEGMAVALQLAVASRLLGVLQTINLLVGLRAQASKQLRELSSPAGHGSMEVEGFHSHVPQH